MRKTSGKRKTRKGTILMALILSSLLLIVAINGSMVLMTDSRIFLEGEGDAVQRAIEELNPQCILILGAGLKPDGTPNLMLADRLDQGIALYKRGAAPKILLSGDNGQERYDEVNAMKEYCLDQGVPMEDIFMDHAGFSTYESIHRASSIFQVESMIIVTQDYHLPRACYLAEKMGIRYLGIAARQIDYGGQQGRDLREIAARCKDFFTGILKPPPTYQGEVIPIEGSGLASHD